MKKIVQKIVLFLLAATMVFGAAACTKGEGGNSYVSDAPEQTIDPDFNEYQYQGTHIYNFTSTGKNIIENGATDYKIVYPAESGDYIDTAVNELILNLAAATKVQMTAVPDTGLVFTSDSKYISLGNTTLAADAGVFVDSEKLTEAGFEIRTVGDSVFMIGGSELGTLNAIYEFLFRTIDFRVYYNDAPYYEEKDAVELYNFAITDIPDYTYRLRDYGVYETDERFARRMRINLESDVWIPVEGDYWHNVFGYLDPDVYGTSHPDWYNSDKTQLCFNAHGDAKEYEAMYEAILKKAKECVDAYPELSNITFTQKDGSYWCNCKTCQAELEKYGTGAPGILKTCNRLAEDLNKYVQGTGRTIKVSLFAYGNSRNAPAVKNADGTFSPIDDSCICGENVYVFCAPQNFDYRYSVYDSENSAVRDNIRAWASLTEQMYIWIYSTNFNNYLLPYNSFDSIQGNYQFFKSIGANYIFNQSQFNQSAATGFSTLKMFLNSRLSWNVNLDYEELLEEFFTNFYLDAAEPMREMFDMFRMHMQYIQSSYNIESGTSTDILKSQYWPKAFLDQILAKADEAYAAIAPLEREDPDMYEILYDRICLETLCFRYIDLSLYSGLKTSQDELAEKKQFRSDAERLNITLFNELTSISSLWDSWGV